MNRVIILGGGFIGSSLSKKLKGLSIEHKLITRENCDFEKLPETQSFLKSIINSKDIIIFSAAVAPVKNIEMFIRNINIIKNICSFFNNKTVEKFINISSDAIFSDSMSPLNEESAKEPDSIHGQMHLFREKYIDETVKSPILSVRPTLIYGYDDPHNGYGPNSFFRKINNNENVTLFGKGEELRDHVYIDDVVEVILKLVEKSSTGKFNIVTGKVISFKEIALIIKNVLDKDIDIIETERVGKMPHNGYREFNNEKIINEIESYKFIDIESGIEKILSISINKSNG